VIAAIGFVSPADTDPVDAPGFHFGAIGKVRTPSVSGRFFGESFRDASPKRHERRQQRVRQRSHAGGEALGEMTGQACASSRVGGGTSR